MTRRFAGLAAVALALGGATLLYHGPGRVLVRGHVGDVAATMLVYALLSLVWRSPSWLRAATTLAVATAIELGQTVWHARSFAGELLVGTTFDARDFVAYVAGVAVALVWELRGRSHAPRL
jgi:hypothetical protein